MNISLFAKDYLLRKNNILLNLIILDCYYLKLNENCIPNYINNYFTTYHLEHLYYTSINMICDFYKIIHNKTFITSYYNLTNQWNICFMYHIFNQLKQKSISSINLFSCCECWDDLFTMIETNPTQFKFIIFSLKRLVQMLFWIKDKNIMIDNECLSIINHITKWTNTLEFKTLDTLSNHINSNDINEFFDNL
jgi:hypothetical protein